MIKFRVIIQVLSFLVVFSLKANAFEDPLNYPSIPVSDPTKSLFLDLALSENRIVAVGERGHIIYSNDLGETWKQAEVPVRTMLSAVTFPGNGRFGWAVGHQGVILASDDGGVSWTKQLDGHEAHQLMVDAFSIAVENKYAELKNPEVEENQERLQRELEDLEFMLEESISFLEEGPTRPFIDVWFRNSSEGYAVGSFGLIVRTDDGGDTWYSPAASLHNPRAFHYNAVDGYEDALFLAGEGGHIQRSVDGGTTWRPVESPYSGTFFDVVVKHQEVLVLGLRGNVLKSSDLGNNWSKIESGTKSTLSNGTFLEDGRYVVSHYGGQLLVSDDAGKELQPLLSSNGGAISSFLLGPEGSVITVGTHGVTTRSGTVYSMRD